MVNLVKDRVNNIVLCYVGTRSVKSVVNEPLGIEAIASSIRHHRPEINVILFNEQIYGTEKLLDIIKSYNPEIIGFSIPNGSFSGYLKIEKIINDIYSGIDKPTIVLGGTVPSFHAEEVVKDSPSSYVIKGEGDQSIIEFIDAVTGNMNLNGVSNLVYMVDGKIIRNQELLPDVNMIQIPERDLMLEAVERGGYAFIETSRGCSWGHCTFCLRPTNERYRRFTVKKVLDDFVRLSSLGVKKIYLTDEELIGSDLDWLETLCDALIKLDLGVNFMATCQSVSICKKNSDDNDKKLEVIKKLKQAGLIKMFLGTESGSVTQLKRYGKSATVEENIQAIRILRDLGIELGIGFINFDPLMELSEIGENIKFIEDNDILFNIFSPFHAIDVREGSGYVKMLKREGLLGEKSIETTCYAYRFKDERVQIIYDICHRVFERWLELQVCLRQISNTSGIIQSRELYMEMRKLQFKFLKDIYKAIEEKDMINDEFKCIEKVYDEKMWKLAVRVLDIIPEQDIYLKNEVKKSLPII